MRAASVGVEANSRGSRLNVNVCFGLVVGDWLLGWLNKTHSYKRSGLSAVEQRGVLLAVLRAVGIIGA